MLEDDAVIPLVAQTSLTDQPVTGASPLEQPTGATSPGVTGTADSVTGATPDTTGIVGPTPPLVTTDTTGLQPTTTPLAPLGPITTTPILPQTAPPSAPAPQTSASGAQAGNQVLIGAPDDTILAGADGNDLLIAPETTVTGTGLTLQGNAGNDTLIGRSGNDMLQGGPGDDMLFGGLGANQLSGGPGQDLFVFEGGSDTIQDFTPAEGDRIRIEGDPATVATLVGSATATPDGVRLVPQTGGSITLVGISAQDLSTDWFTPAP